MAHSCIGWIKQEVATQDSTNKQKVATQDSTNKQEVATQDSTNKQEVNEQTLTAVDKGFWAVKPCYPSILSKAAVLLTYFLLEGHKTIYTYVLPNTSAWC